MGKGLQEDAPERQVFIHGDKAGTAPSFDSLESETGWRGLPVACKNLSKSLEEKKCHPTLRITSSVFEIQCSKYKRQEKTRMLTIRMSRNNRQQKQTIGAALDTEVNGLPM